MNSIENVDFEATMAPPRGAISSLETGVCSSGTNSVKLRKRFLKALILFQGFLKGSLFFFFAKACLRVSYHIPCFRFRIPILISNFLEAFLRAILAEYPSGEQMPSWEQARS